MDPPPPSQPLRDRNPALFYNTDGNSIQVYAEVWGIQNRPKLVRLLKNNGASICHGPRDAHVILVDSQTLQGKQFIRDWGGDENRVVLDYSWVRKSLDAGRALLAEDQWGGCLTHDDGLPIAESGSDEEEIKSPLPTPRVTPDEPYRSRSYPTHSDSRASSKARNVDSTQGTMPPPSPSESSSAPAGLRVSTDGPDFTQPSTSTASPINGINHFAQMQYPLQMGPMTNLTASQTPQMSMQVLQAQQQMLANMLMTQAGYQFNPQQYAGSQPQMAAFSMALMDTMKNHGMGGWQVSQGPHGSQMQPGYDLAEATSHIQEPSLPFPNIPSTMSEMSTGRSLTNDRPATPSPLLGPVILESLINGKGKHKAAASSKRRKTSSSSFKASSDSHAGPSSSVMGPPSSQKKLFSKAGRELCFFVQIDLFNRFSVVNSIKKNGGRIVDSQTAADFVVLYSGNQYHKTFNDLLRSAQAAGKHAVQAKFVHDCVEQNTLLDPSPYLYESVIKRKRKRSTSVVSVESASSEHDSEALAKERKRLQKNQRQAEYSRRKKLEQQTLEKNSPKSNSQPQKVTSGSQQVSNKSSVKTTPQKKSPDAAVVVGPRTPTPPPEHTRQVWGQGYKFSPAEDEYALRYAKILLERDHEISMNAVSSAIYKQMPHHTLKSWRSHFPAVGQADFEQWRKRASIAYRKAQSFKESQALSAASTSNISDVEEAPPPSVSPAPAVDERETKDHSDWEDDINTVVQFFVEGNDDDKSVDPTQVWARLTEKACCKTRERWDEFYDANFDEVLRRYRILIPEPEPDT